MLSPEPGNTSVTQRRHNEATARRLLSAAVSLLRYPQRTLNNGELSKYSCAPSSFHKGLPHNEYGIPDSLALAGFVTALNRQEFAPGEYARFDVALGPLGIKGSNPGERDNSHGNIDRFHTKAFTNNKEVEVRNWESPLGGHVFDIQGPDAGDLAMARVPTLTSSELTAEMAEVYALALIRDLPFPKFADADHAVKWFIKSTTGAAELEPVDAGFTVSELIAELNKLVWFKKSAATMASFGDSATPQENRRRLARLNTGETSLSAQSLFRGSVPGAKDGPYISQFLLIGNRDESDDSSDNNESQEYVQSYAKDARNIARSVKPVGANQGEAQQENRGIRSGYINFGAQRIDQRINAHLAGRDHLTDWPLWLDVQNGAAVNGSDAYFSDRQPRFIGRPRDLATYVHFDQLYQAYFNACLLLFSNKVRFDQGFPSGMGHLTRGSFATFGGPHVLSLMTEVASRALKAVRRQKYQHHLRGRPEQLAAMLTLAASDKADQLSDNAREDMQVMLHNFTTQAPQLLDWTCQYNQLQNQQREDNEDYLPRLIESCYSGFKPSNEKNYLLPMAFPEGSPMHAAYGAGHATVAGACVTILKAFFELFKGEDSNGGKEASVKDGLQQPLTVAELHNGGVWWQEVSMGEGGLGLPNLYQAPTNDNPAEDVHDLLEVVPDQAPESLTINGELNKLAANIAIGRNMAGVHFYTDYYDSLRMGERLAVGILEEQMATYVDPVSMRLKTFDDDSMIISGDGNGACRVEIGDNNGIFAGGDTYEEWWNRHIESDQIASS